MRLALWQGYSPGSDMTKACAEAEAALSAASALGVAALVLPEIWLQGYNQPNIQDRALSIDSAPLRRLATAARARSTALVVGYAERDGNAVFNSAACFGPDGTLLANHRKLQLYGPRERAIYKPGGEYTIFLLGAKIASILICYDVEFAPHVNCLADKGVNLILAPTANMQPFTHVVRHTVPAMAANYGMTIAYANYCGSEGDLTYVGGSLIAGPHGEVLAKAGEYPALLVVDIPAHDPLRVSTQSADFQAVR
jgi:5-aminopentanamidase